MSSDMEPDRGFEDFLGREETREDSADPERLARLAALLDRDWAPAGNHFRWRIFSISGRMPVSPVSARTDIPGTEATAYSPMQAFRAACGPEAGYGLPVRYRSAPS